MKGSLMSESDTTKRRILGCIFIGDFKITNAPNGDLWLENQSTGKAGAYNVARFEDAIDDFLREEAWNV